MKKRLRVIQGGSSAGKTIAILLILIDVAQTNKGKLISVVSHSVPHLKRGAIRDFLNIMEAHGYYKEANWNRSDFIYTFETGSKIEFFSAENADKVRGPRRDILFLNEANNLLYETYTQLAIRTNEYILIDYNPVTEFWVQTEIIPHQDHDFVILTYKDNDALPEPIVKELESRMGRKQWWRVYGEGLLGEVEGRIYTGWIQIDEVPPEARLLRRGLDYGYSNDPTAIVNIYKWNDAYIWDEVTYQKGLSNRQIADILLNLDEPSTLIVADSAEPKSNDELLLYGINLLSANKGQGSVNHGIQVVQSQRIFYTRRSINIRKEYNNYLWEKDPKTDRFLSVPQDGFNHMMDAGRYAMETLNIDTGLSDVEEYLLAQARLNSGTNFAR